jgi:methionine aminopeptidase
VTAAIKQIAELYNVRSITGTLMHQMKQYVIDGKKMILLRELEQDQQKVEACTFETGEVYAIDIAMSTGDGKPRDLGTYYGTAVGVAVACLFMMFFFVAWRCGSFV